MDSSWKKLDRLLALALFLLTGVMVLGPLGFLVSQGTAGGVGEIWVRAREVSLIQVLLRVLFLALSATGFALLLALPLSWLLARSDVPFKPVLRWLAPLPLAIPPYIGAMVFQIVFSQGGLADSLAARLTAASPSEVHLVDLYTPLGAAWVLGLFTYPYIYLLAEALLKRTNPALEEAARSQGLRPWQVFFRVTIPLLRPALLAGGLMVFLYGWADFGVVSLLRVRTLTTVIYYYIRGTMDWTVPAGFSVILAAITILVLLVELRILGRAGYTQISGSSRVPQEVKLGPWRWPAFAYIFVVFFFSLFLPLGVLVHQTVQLSLKEVVALLSRDLSSFGNSLGAATMGATLALALALCVGWLQERRLRGVGASLFLQVGTAIPGTVLGLGMTGFFLSFFPWIYGTPLIVVLAVVILHITPAVQSVKSALAQLPLSIEEASRGLGRTPAQTLWRVSLPLTAPGLLGGWLLVFILCMRELAATLIVRPPGFDTLPVRVWILTMDVGPEPQASLLALALVGTIALPWLFLLISKPKGFAFGW